MDSPFKTNENLGYSARVGIDEILYKEKLMRLKSGLREELLTGKVTVNKLLSEVAL